MFPTSEIRWFNKGQLPEDMLQWFYNHPGKPEEKAERTDYYLLHTGPSLGIKLREGKIEIKQRKTQMGIMEFMNQQEGFAEQWGKWSFSIDEENPDIIPLIRPSSDWLPVTKKRFLLRYAWEHERIFPVSTDAQYMQACDTELSVIHCNDETWWSLCFEAFGREGQNTKKLKQVTSWLFDPPAPQHFESGHSFAYPYWLSLVLQ